MTEMRDSGQGNRFGARWAAIRLMPRVSLPLTLAAVGAQLLLALLPVGFMLATGAVVGALPGTIDAGFDSPDGRRLIGALAVAAVTFVVGAVLEPVATLLSQTVGRRVDIHLRSRVMRATLSPPGIQHLEDPRMLDAVSLARGVAPAQWTPASAIVGLMTVGRWYVQGIVAAVIVARYWWWVAVVSVLVSVATRLLFRRELIRIVDVLLGETHALRRSFYYRDLTLTPAAAKETRVFGLAGWILRRYTFYWTEAMTDVWRQRAQSRWKMGLAIVALTVVLFGGFAVVGIAAARGEIALGALAVLTQALLGITVMGNVSDTDLMIEHGVGAIPAALGLEEKLAGSGAALAGVLPADEQPRDAIRFEGVRFRYPGTERDVCDDLSLTIPAGRSLAIVGVNGAGKTTLVKLLSRLYDPTEGRIAVDGIDLREVEPRAWQRRIAAIFQDFVQYHTSAADNVAFGAPERAGERDLIEAAARRAGADEVIAKLPKSFDTMLSRQYQAGADLSGGEWQRIALARALFAVTAGAGVLILDEPTANLDVRAEAMLFDRFLELTQGLTTILISHRFSTVRRADRIVVLSEGRVAEEGTHEELLARGGLYAEMFHLQAARFAEPDATAPEGVGA